MCYKTMPPSQRAHCPNPIKVHSANGTITCRQNSHRDRRWFWYVYQDISSRIYTMPINHTGINLAFAKNLLAKRCNVLFADLALRPEAQELVSNHSNASQTPAKAIFQQTDVRDWRQLDRMFDVAKEKLGDVDIVCPGAGVYEPVCQSPSFRASIEDWADV